MPVNFEGAKLMVQKGLSNHFQVSHTINLCSQNPSGYRFGATYVGTKQMSPTEAFPVILGDIDPSGNLNANFIHQLTPAVRCKFASQVIIDIGAKVVDTLNNFSLISDSKQQNDCRSIDDRLQG
jgi:mitochondrial import receptor subunit TOM40